MELTIGLAGPSDLETLLELLAAQFRELEIPLSSGKLTAGVEGPLHDPRHGSFLLVRLASRPVAVAYLSFQWSLEHGGRSAWLEELYVLPQHRGDGIGRQLLLEACAHAAARGCAAVDLEVEEAHARAAHLYAREGFRPHRRARWVRLIEG